MLCDWWLHGLQPSKNRFKKGPSTAFTASWVTAMAHLKFLLLLLWVGEWSIAFTSCACFNFVYLNYSLGYDMFVLIKACFDWFVYCLLCMSFLLFVSPLILGNVYLFIYTPNLSGPKRKSWHHATENLTGINQDWPCSVTWLYHSSKNVSWD